MPGAHARPRSSRTRPHRSQSARKAYANGSVQWVIDLTQPGARRLGTAPDAPKRRAHGLLGLTAGAIWLANAVSLVVHLQRP